MDLTAEHFSLILISTYINSMFMFYNTIYIISNNRITFDKIDTFIDDLPIVVRLLYYFHSRGKSKDLLREAAVKGKTLEAKIVIYFCNSVIALILLMAVIGVISGLSQLNWTRLIQSLALVLYIMVTREFLKYHSTLVLKKKKKSDKF